MKAERENARIETTREGTITWRLPAPMDRDTARWLQAVALPAALAALPPEVPSEPDAKVGESDGQIAGQTTIDEVLGLR